MYIHKIYHRPTHFIKDKTFQWTVRRTVQFFITSNKDSTTLNRDFAHASSLRWPIFSTRLEELHKCL